MDQYSQATLDPYLKAIVNAFSLGADVIANSESLQEFVAEIHRQSSIQVLEQKLRQLSHRGYLRSALVVMATELLRQLRMDLLLLLAQELLDALAPHLGMDLLQATLLLPEINQTRPIKNGPFVTIHLLLGSSYLHHKDWTSALRHFETVLASDIDHGKAIQGRNQALQELQRRGHHSFRKGLGLEILDGLDDLHPFEEEALERYKIARPIGRGRYAVVYQAADRHVGREVALKRLIHIHQNSANIHDRVLKARFFTEAEALARVRSPYVIALLDVQPKYRCIILSLCKGGNLRSALRRGLLGPTDVPRIGEQLCEALQAIHHSGAIHRDIKPVNILLRDNQTKSPIAIGDFGLALTANQSQDIAGGTLRYLAPELRGGQKQASPASDIFSAGVVLLEIALAPTPLPAVFDQIAHPLHADEYIPNTLPKEWRTRLRSMLTSQPEQRKF